MRWILLLLLALSMHAQDTWTIETNCVTEAAEPPSFDGVILTHEPDEGIRALRADVPTTYYIAFEGSNFTAAGSMSPDGKWVALPYGYIQTAATSDVRYIVNELRVHSTERVPRIVARMGWTVSFQVEDGIPPIRWIDNDTFLFATGMEHDLVEVKPFTQEISESELDGYTDLSRDLSRGIAPHFEKRGLFDLESGDLLSEFENGSMSMFEWSDDALMTVDFPQLTLRDTDGAMVETVMTFSEDQRVLNFDWSENRFMFSLYDPYKNENFLYVGDMETRTITETCVRLRNEPGSAVWSPDGTMVALLGYDAGLQLYALDGNTVYQVAEYTGGIIGWGAGEF